MKKVKNEKGWGKKAALATVGIVAAAGIIIKGAGAVAAAPVALGVAGLGIVAVILQD